MNQLEYIAAREYRLTPEEARVFILLHRAVDVCPHELIHSDKNTRGVLICRLRRKLASFGFEITTISKKGFLLQRAPVEVVA